MAEFQRKIELQSPEDLQYLIANVRRAATEKIDRDLPPIEGEDKMRTRVEEMVDEYINSIFSATADNVSINGIEPSAEMMDSMLRSRAGSKTLEIEEHEPFNGRLFERAKDLARQEEDLIEEIAALRRNMPAKLVENVKSSYRKGVESDEAILKDREARRIDGKGVGIPRGERQDDVEKSWDGAVKGLEGVMGRMGEVVAKKERAERAEEYVVKGR